MVIEDCYSQLCKLDRVRPAMVADGLGQLQIRWPSVHVVFCETRQLAGEWTYRFLARSPRPGRPPNTLLCNASHPSRSTLPNLRRRPPRRYRPPRRFAPGAPSAGLPVPDRGRLGPEIWAAWHDGNPPNRPQRQGPPYCPPPPDRKAHRSHERGMHPLRSRTRSTFFAQSRRRGARPSGGQPSVPDSSGIFRDRSRIEKSRQLAIAPTSSTKTA